MHSGHNVTEALHYVHHRQHVEESDGPIAEARPVFAGVGTCVDGNSGRVDRQSWWSVDVHN